MKGNDGDMSRTKCHTCKEYGHISSNYHKKLCNYCKQHDHIINECPTCPRNRRINAFQARINGPTSDKSFSLGSENQFDTATPGQALTPEMVQHMIVLVFSYLGYKVTILHLIFVLLILLCPII